MVFFSKYRVFLFFILFISVFSTSLFASGLFESDVYISTAPSFISGAYDCEVELVLSDTVIVGASGIAGSYALGFGSGSSGTFSVRHAISGNGDILDYQIFDSASSRVVIKDQDASPNAANLLTGTAYLGGTDVNFDVAVFEGQVLSPGTYDDTVAVYLYGGRNGKDGLQETDSMAISIDIPSFVSVSVVDTGGDFDSLKDSMDLDFGMLEEGSSQDMDVVVRANINYTVLLESANHGYLANTDSSDSSTVPYTLEVDGVQVDLRSGQIPVVTGSGPTLLSGNGYNLEFVIGDPGGATSGSYEDIVTVTVTAQ